MFRNFKIRTRLVLLFIILALLPLIVTVVIVYKDTGDALQSKISTYSVQVMSQVSQNIKRELDRLQNDSVEIEFSDVVQQTLLHYNQMSPWEIENAQYTMRQNLAKKFSFLHDVSDVLIYTRQRKKINAYGDYGISFNLKKEYLKPYLDRLYRQGGGVVWIPVNTDSEEHLVKYATSAEQLSKSNGVVMGRAVKSLSEGDIIGYLMIRTNERYLSNIYKDIDIGQDADIFVLDRNGVVVSSRSSRVPVTSRYPDGNLIQNIRDNFKNGSYVFNYEFNGQRYLVSYAPIQSVGWFVVGKIPYSYLHSDAQQMYADAIYIGISCFIAAVFLAYLFSASILAPLKRLRKVMNQAEQGNLSVSVSDGSNDEIGEITQHFNNMLTEINNLLENVKNTEHQKRLAELKALQAQINPHFLSNTLNTVRFLAKAQKAQNIESIITSLIQLFHMTMGKGDDLIPIREEIEYIKNYINIQEYRYLNKFKINYGLEPEILGYKIPRLILQPVVENALLHGIGPMEGQGLIVIKGFVYENDIKFVITDNGTGIPPQKLETILQKRSTGLNGMGIANVNERIKLYFGRQYGLSIESVPDLYTTVEVTLPAVRQGREA
ncbi:cache domain-containing sensor histidine kinase [Lucifera butyrica]|nr:sensor histidine kinase [Lucifera butyrica]